MPATRLGRLGSASLALSALIFAVYFVNVLLGGPLRSEPWMGDVAEMLCLFASVTFFVLGTLAREAEAEAARDAPSRPAGAPPGAQAR